MLSIQHRMLYVVVAALVAFADSVGAKSTSTKVTSTKVTSTKKPKPTSKVNSGGKCYDQQGNIIRCATSNTTWIIVGVVVGIVVLLLILCLCFVFRKRIKTLVSKKKNTKGAHQPVATEEAAVSHYPYEASPYNPDQKQGDGMAESEKPHDNSYSTPYDPYYPPQQYAHQYPPSDASGYNVPAFTPAQPQDHSYTQNTNPTTQPGTSAQQYYNTSVVA